ncbi:uncharacterized protein LOC121973134 [Zingiber officinale]|uniref:DUF7866 domain-containing protein n=1 Tax=Zingiber officinale TaxID=94328 RepID=A0A8J5H776_ZINOF|nr:uncharacterized protein LOC121973134 [Zingiber officinale]KAG6513549.1 hypothetical protein ZIOFF_023881 [Zingiber officinale]
MANLLLALSILLLTFLNRGSVFYTAAVEYKPAPGIAEQRHLHTDDRRMLDPFQLCLDCRCCAANDSSICSMMPCCFGIDCNLPEKPFGVCAFVPKTCNCTSCQ